MRKNGEPHRHEPDADAEAEANGDELAFIDDIEVTLSDKSRKESPEDGERLL